jgi:hypothetical protein
MCCILHSFQPSFPFQLFCSPSRYPIGLLPCNDQIVSVSTCECLVASTHYLYCNFDLKLTYAWYRNSTIIFSSIGSDPVPVNGGSYWDNLDSIKNATTGLNYWEQLWAAWYLYMQNDVLATGIMSFVMHEVVYFGRSLPWIMIDSIPWFRRYKIQQVRVMTRALPANI